MSSTQEVGDIFGAAKGQAQAMLRSPTVLIATIGLWGMNLFFFRLFGINYKYVLQYDLLKEQQKEQIKTSQRVSNVHHAYTSDDDDFLPLVGGNATLTSSPNSSPSTSSVAVADGGQITWYKLVFFSISLLFLLHLTTWIWMERLERGVLGAVFFFYLAVIVFVALPLPSNEWLHRALAITCERTFALIHPRCWYFRYSMTVSAGPEDSSAPGNANPLSSGDGTTPNPLPVSTASPSTRVVPVIPRPVPFVDVFYADAMCSLSKVFFDWGMLLHMASHYPEPIPQEATKILIPSAFAAVPFLIRARQCLLMFGIGRLLDDPKRYQHVANAIKYSTSIWPLLLSAYQKTLDNPVSAEKLDGLLVFLQTINALYALYWDIVMDWGMMQNPQALVAQACLGGSMGSNSSGDSLASGQHHHRGRGVRCYQLFLRPRLRFGLTITALIVAADTFLRFSWLLRFVSHRVFASNDSMVLCTQFLEVFRRAIWNLLRVEWENIKQKSKQLKARDSLSDHEDEDDEVDGTGVTDSEQEMVSLNETSGSALTSPAPSSNSSATNQTREYPHISPSKKQQAS